MLKMAVSTIYTYRTFWSINDFICMQAKSNSTIINKITWQISNELIKVGNLNKEKKPDQ